MTDDATPSSRPLPDVIGGRYRIVSRLGVGGMGVVYKAVDQQLNRPVAVKAVEDRRLLMPGSSGRLRTEALAAASLDHPYICKVYELVETPTEAFIVMEFVEGETLSSILKRGVPSLLQTLHICREIAEGLAEAHSHGLVHRDVKPANVMVTPSGHVKLLDFGVAGADVTLPAADHTRTVSPHLTVHAGTPQYMAPEQASGQPITSRADLFSLGVVLYECVSGALPFSGSTTFDYVRHVMQSPPRRLDRVAPEAPADLVELVDRCLEKVPGDRPESADYLVKELRRLSDGLTSPGASIRTAGQARAGRRWRWVAIAALAVAAIAAGWRWLSTNAGPAEAPWQRRSFVTTSAEEFGSRVSPNAEWLSFIATAGGGSRILVQRIDGGESRPLTLGPGRPVSQLWSPDGNQIACVIMLDNEPVLQVYPAFFGGSPLQSIAIDRDLDSVRLLRWIGRDVYLRANIQNQQGLTVRRVSLDAPASAVVISDTWKIDGTLRSVDVRPDGRAAVIGVGKNGQEDLWTLNLDGSSPTRLTADAAFDKDPIWIGSGDRVVFQSNRGGQADLWQMDVRTKALIPLAGEGEEVADSSSADGRIISVQQRARDANLWMFSGSSAQQITQDSLNDYSPALSADGRVIAFQRSQPTPSRGYTILDAKVFVAPFDGRTILEAKAEADGFAPDLSAEGQWLAYMQISDVPSRMTLSVRDLRAGGTMVVSKTAALPSLALAPVDWSTRLTAWSRTGAELYFVDQPADHQLRRYRPGDREPGPALATAPAGTTMRDLFLAPDTGRLAYLSGNRDQGIVVHELDPSTGSTRVLARFPPSKSGVTIVGRGWLDRRFVLARSLPRNADGTGDFEILLTNESGDPTVAGRVTHAYAATMRLHAAKRVLYMTRLEQGTSNVFAFAIDTGALTQVTQNALPGVTFSGLQPTSRGVLGVREERRDDIWLMQQDSTKRPGNSAGR